ncbi:MAG: hypothetical protein HZB43_10860 [candidate division Zixibacteria bacterium]|nr:hypothetical protein [candidate division Zixibacteria bacterium]
MSESFILTAVFTAIGLGVGLLAGWTFLSRRRPGRPAKVGDPRLLPSEDPRLRQMRVLTPEQFQRLSWLHTILAEASGTSFTEWVDGLEADSEVEQQLKILEAVASTYSKVTSTAFLSPKDKQQLFENLIMLSYDPNKPIVRRVRLPLGSPEWGTIVDWYRAAIAREESH